ncbi:MAG: NAD(P)/FAD-dependent oxidoreductase [Verrucomicrobiota bacterium]
MSIHPTLIVGAGPAGIGCALALSRAEMDPPLILEANTVGSSFSRWPKEMRLITPSFHGNPFLQTDLNAITPDTSPADFAGREHLSGEEYAAYLRTAVDHFGLDVCENEKVLEVLPTEEGFAIRSSQDRTLRTQTLIWAAGEFSLPRREVFPGSELCPHTSDFRSWDDYEGEGATVIGGYESGIDAAYNLVRRGKKVIVISSGEPWSVDHPDPSESLSPFTRERLEELLRDFPERLVLWGHTTITSVSKLADRFIIETEEGEVFDYPSAPLLATGFHSALEPIRHLFAWEGGVPQFTEDDESTLHPGLYYSGPSLVQRSSKFCFIYKFRARFGVIARSLVQRLEDREPDLEDDRKRGFLVDDLECCTNCECALESEEEPVETAR